MRCTTGCVVLWHIVIITVRVVLFSLPINVALRCFSCLGSVFVDGQEKTTRLPAITSGSTILFDTELLPSEKVRVTIEVSEKIITFDWPLPDRPTQTSASTLSTFGAGCEKEDKNQTSLFFAARLSSASWSVTVEWVKIVEIFGELWIDRRTSIGLAVSVINYLEFVVLFTLIYLF